MSDYIVTIERSAVQIQRLRVTGAADEDDAEGRVRDWLNSTTRRDPLCGALPEGVTRAGNDYFCASDEDSWDVVDSEEARS